MADGLGRRPVSEGDRELRAQQHTGAQVLFDLCDLGSVIAESRDHNGDRRFHRRLRPLTGQSRRVVEDLVERSGWLGWIQPQQGLQDVGLPRLVLANQAGHVWLDAEWAGVLG